MRNVVILFLIGLSLIFIGSGIQLQTKPKEKITFASDNTTNKNYKVAKINLNQIKESTENKEEPKVVQQVIENPLVTPEPEVKNWYYPTNNGSISGGMGYRTDGFHYGYDITSPLGSREVIYPIAEGIITGVFRDSAGANIITVGHNVNNQDYSSMYVHLSSYAPNTYVGKHVTVNDPLGYMGQTGNATGVHLHLEVTDCLLFADNDYNCSSISKYFNYEKRRYNEGFYGAGTILSLPNSWNSR